MSKYFFYKYNKKNILKEKLVDSFADIDQRKYIVIKIIMIVHDFTDHDTQVYWNSYI